MRENYDVVLIGGGISSLVAGNYLAGKGLKTAIFEQHHQVGGYVTSFQRKGYTFEGGLTSFGSNGIVFPILEELGVEIDFVPIKRQYITERFNAVIDGSFAGLKTEMLKAYPKDERDLVKFFHWADIVTQGCEALCSLPYLTGKVSLREMLALPFKHFNFLKFMLLSRNLTKQDLNRRFFKNPEIIAFMDKLGYPVMTAFVTAGMWYSFKSDYFYPLNGMQALSNLLAQHYQNRGGELFVKNKVTKIMQKAGRVTGVLLANGQEVTSKVVFANMDLRTVFLQLLEYPEVDTVFLEKLRTGEPSESMFTIFLGLKNKGFAASPYQISTSHCWFELKDSAGQTWELSVNIPTVDDPKLSPDGETVIISCFEEYSDWAGLKDRGEEYYHLKAAKIEKIMELIQQVIPDLDERLEVIEGATPLTYERYTGNFKGATAGWNWNPRLRPKFDWRTEGKIPGLYLAGQWMYNPGGVPSAMLTARNAAMQCLKEFGQ